MELVNIFTLYIYIYLFLVGRIVGAIFIELVNISNFTTHDIYYFFFLVGRIVGAIFIELVNIFTLYIYLFILGGEHSWCNIHRPGEYFKLYHSWYILLVRKIVDAIFMELVNISNFTTHNIFIFSFPVGKISGAIFMELMNIADFTTIWIYLFSFLVQYL